MPQEHGGKRSGSGRKPKKTDPTLQNALAEAVPYEKWVSIFTNIATIADQIDDKRAAIMAARELAKLGAPDKHRAPTDAAPVPPTPAPGPKPPLIIYEHNNDHRLPDDDSPEYAECRTKSAQPAPPVAKNVAIPAHRIKNVKPRPILRPPTDARFWQSIPLPKFTFTARPSLGDSLDPKGFHTTVYPPHTPHTPQLPLVPQMFKNPSGLFLSPRYSLRE